MNPLIAFYIQKVGGMVQNRITPLYERLSRDDVLQGERPALVKRTGKTTYQVKIHFSITIRETMSDKTKRMLRNEINRI